MICPNCDNVINATGCQACGWKTGDPFPVHRLAPNSSHPLKEGVGVYPPRIGGPRAIQTAPPQINSMDDPYREIGMQATPDPEPELKQDQIIVPEPEPESAPAPIPDPVSTTVQ